MAYEATLISNRQGRYKILQIRSTILVQLDNVVEYDVRMDYNRIFYPTDYCYPDNSSLIGQEKS